jgi:hypothetical protein
MSSCTSRTAARGVRRTAATRGRRFPPRPRVTRSQGLWRTPRAHHYWQPPSGMHCASQSSRRSTQPSWQPTYVFPSHTCAYPAPLGQMGLGASSRTQRAPLLSILHLSAEPHSDLSLSRSPSEVSGWHVIATLPSHALSPGAHSITGPSSQPRIGSAAMSMHRQSSLVLLMRTSWPACAMPSSRAPRPTPPRQCRRQVRAPDAATPTQVRGGPGARPRAASLTLARIAPALQRQDRRSEVRLTFPTSWDACCRDRDWSS